jgi:thioredoxin reductase
MTHSDPPRVAVLGAGPVGLEAALYARRLDFPVNLYERGRPGEYLHRWGHVRMFSPFGMNSTSLGRAAIRADWPGHLLPGDHDLHTGREYLAAYLEPLSRCAALRDGLHLGTQVVHVSRRGPPKGDGSAQAAQPFLLLVRGPGGADRVDLADVVLDCTGTFGRHRWLGDDGAPVPGETAAEPHISYWLEDVAGAARDRYAGKSVLVVGAGYSAATTVTALADLARSHPQTRTVWLARAADARPIRLVRDDPLNERRRLGVRANGLAMRGAGNVEFHADSAVTAVAFRGPDRGFAVTARVAGMPRAWDVDRVVANIGFTPDALADSEVREDGRPGPPPSGPAALKCPEPNFYILGSKSYGRNSDFLLGDGFAQVRAAFALITSKSGLDLHAKG